MICATNFASALLIESGLSFLGIGAQPPLPSWGGMIRDYYPYIITGKAISALSEVLIAISVLSLNTLSGALKSRVVWTRRTASFSAFRMKVQQLQEFFTLNVPGTKAVQVLRRQLIVDKFYSITT